MGCSKWNRLSPTRIRKIARLDAASRQNLDELRLPSPPPSPRQPEHSFVRKEPEDKMEWVIVLIVVMTTPLSGLEARRFARYRSEYKI
jgi:hypothetical protein